MKKTLVLVVLLIAGITQLFAVAYTFSDDMVNIPEAYILNHKTVSFDLGLKTGFANDADGDLNMRSSIIGRLNVGLYDRGEVGLVINTFGNPYVNIKLNLLKEQRKMPQLSIGMANIFSEVRKGNYESGVLSPYKDLVKNSPYIVASKKYILVSSIPYLEYMELKANLGWGMRRFHGDGNLSKVFQGFFFGAHLKPTPSLAVFGEFDGTEFNAGFTIYSEKLTYQLSMQRMINAVRFLGNTDNGGINIGTSIGYKFDHFADKKIVRHDKEYYSYYKSIAPLIEKRVYLDEMDLQQEASLYETSTTSSLFNRAENCYEEGKFNEAIEYYDQVIINAGNEVPIALYHTGLCYQEMGDQGKRDHYWQKLVRDYPDHYLVTKVIAEDEKFASVAEAPRRSSRKQDGGITYKTSDSPRFQYKEALMHYHFEDYSGAAEKFQSFINDNPDHGLVHNAKFLLAESYKNTKSYNEAIKVYEEIMPRAGIRRAETLLSIAECQIALEKYNDAKVSLEKVLSSYSGSFHAAQAETLMKKIPNK